MRLRTGHAVYQWTHREFSAPDPWNGNHVAPWKLVVYRMVRGSQLSTTPLTTQFLTSDTNALPVHFPIGIAVFESNRHVMLPMVLQRLWRDGLVPDIRLPDLLHRAEAQLKPRDLPGSTARMFRWLGSTYAMLAIGILVLALWLKPFGAPNVASPETDAAALCRWMAFAVGLLSAWCWALAFSFTRRQNALREFFLSLVADHG